MRGFLAGGMYIIPRLNPQFNKNKWYDAYETIDFSFVLGGNVGFCKPWKIPQHQVSKLQKHTSLVPPINSTQKSSQSQRNTTIVFCHWRWSMLPGKLHKPLFNCFCILPFLSGSGWDPPFEDVQTTFSSNCAQRYVQLVFAALQTNLIYRKYLFTERLRA